MERQIQNKSIGSAHMEMETGFNSWECMVHFCVPHPHHNDSSMLCPYWNPLPHRGSVVHCIMGVQG